MPTREDRALARRIAKRTPPEQLPALMKARDLRLADTVQMGWADTAFNTAVVTQVTDKAVSLYRPYAVTADFSYTGGVIAYVGIETWDIERNDHLYRVLARKELK